MIYSDTENNSLLNIVLVSLVHKRFQIRWWTVCEKQIW